MGLNISRNSRISTMKRVFSVTYAGHEIRYCFRFKTTPQYFARHISLSNSKTPDVSITEEQFNYFRKIHSAEYSDEYVEYKGLLYLTANELLKYRCCIFHSVSFIWNKKAWLLTADSGTGKTTQYMNWIQKYPDEIQMISGDMPVLDFFNNRIVVHPSPWNGKEKIGNSVSAELGGIIILKQDHTNTIQPADKKTSILTLFRQFIASPETEEDIYTLSKMIETIILNVPIWVFFNTGSIDSTILMRKTLEEYISQENSQ